jgi:hypothetical protein
MLKHLIIAATLALVLLPAGGCANRPTLFANPDPNLRKTRDELAADASTRFPFKEHLPQAKEVKARAEAAYLLNRLEVVNFTGQDWTNVEVWVNRQYVCFVPVMEDRKLKEIHFPMLYDGAGRHFPMDNRQVRVEKVEILRDGTLYEIVCKPADL